MRIITLFILLITAPILSQAEGLFKIQYRNVPDSIKGAVEYACDMWNSYIDSDITINVMVEGKNLSAGSGAYAKATSYHYNFTNAPQQNILYPVALAEKIAGENLNAFEATDIEVVINLQQPWFLDQEGEEIGKRIDLKTVLCHELCHGLGFSTNIIATPKAETTESRLERLIRLTSTDLMSLFSSGNLNGIIDEGEVQRGVAVISTFPTVFDAYLFTPDGLTINELKGLSSEALFNQITDTLLFQSDYTAATLGAPVALYAPYEYDAGSTIIHLYEGSSESLLMGGKLYSGEIVRIPSNETLAMLYGMGWKSIFIKHTEIKDSEVLTDSVAIDFALKSELPVDTASLQLHYSYDGFKNTKSVAPALFDEMFSYKTAPLGFEYTVDYFFTITDSVGRTFRFPNEEDYSFSRGVDTIAPEIVHTPVLNIDLNNTSTFFTASISDNAEVKDIQLEIITSNSEGGFDTVANTLTIVNKMVNYELIHTDNFIENQLIQYRFIATDNASETNTAYLPSNQGFYTTAISKPRARFSTEFENASSEPFILEGFSIKQEFDSYSLNTPHQYKNSGIDGDSINYIATLSIPIIIQETGAYMSFSEIALVEIHQPSSSYGEYGFWDFAIVEGSKDGINWHPLEFEGYDASLHGDWEDLYISDIVDSAGHRNSFAVPTVEMYREHTIDLKANKYFRTGDIINIRFRLMSDEYSYGWGWSIDNLKIQTEDIVSTEKPEKQSLKVFPQRCTDVVNFTTNYQPEQVYIINMSGTIVKTESGNNGPVSVQELSKGGYYLCIKSKNGVISRPFIKQ